MNKNIYYIIIITSIVILASCSQDFYLKKANKEYNDNNFYLASIEYKQAISRGSYISDDNNLKIANTFYNIKDYKTALKFYNKVDVSKKDSKSQLNYAKILQFNKDFKKAKQAFINLKKIGSKQYNDSTIDKFIESCVLSLNNTKPSNKQYKINKSKINVQGESFGLCFYNSGVLYSAPVKLENNYIVDIPFTVDKYGNTIKNIYYSNISDKGEILDSSIFIDSANQKHHIGSVSYLPDSNRFYFSETVKEKKNSIIKIFSIDKIGEEFKNLKELSFNSNSYSCAHPSITADGKTLFFTSDMSGGYGKTDIYSTTFENGKWKKPVNLGKEVNTEANEMFPYIKRMIPFLDLKAINNQYKDEIENAINRVINSGWYLLGKEVNTEANEMFPYIKENGVLYYSSNGKVGFGGLDIYYALKKNNKWTHIVHKDMPLNSYADDFAYVENTKNNKQIYFSSNRNSKPGFDNIYFAQKLDLPPDTIKGRIIDNLTDKALDGATLCLLIDSVSGDTLAKAYTDENGNYTLIIPKKREEDDEEHLFTVIKKDGYEDKVIDFEGRYNDTDRPSLSNLDIAMKLTIKEEQVIEFHNIYFDFGKADLKPSSVQVLDKLVKVMNENPKMKIELSAHTDSKSSKRYNKKLSYKRANSAKIYMLSKGIVSNKIVATGYGETRILNRCKDGVDCSDEEHAINRRIEVKVLSN